MIRPDLQSGTFVLDELLANRRWWRRDEPFAHVVAHDVFKPGFHEQLTAAFGHAQRSEARPFKRNMPGYDALGMDLPPHCSGPLAVFICRAWHDMLARLFSIEATGDMAASLHHHPVGSASGRPHNDLNPGWFIDQRRADGINVADHTLCSYRTGVAAHAGLTRHVTVRAAAMIYYLGNPVWCAGDGGETGLYERADDPVGRPRVSVPPINNSLVCFPCMPYSYHSFISNRRHVRNAVVLWVHRSMRDAIERWGSHEIVQWRE
ncbi:2OG-Fe(II) oxygenase [Paraburkholderia youngii]|uniref:Prolyl 4-hydroxylase alpha subunit Fe(2+) 2OG dioxygenase domain-containing protein n=1 Tax=Paraburkholderia youngii TaxID=2782701 RepID=A0A7W8P5R7_9BURK|nr:2OG-Fe(II) oxygenase [Paraburkholderia youngii]MBB5402643.1 hypothetical protein [Paraburkholderia youngii]